MPADIEKDTCPAPQCNLSEQDIEQFLDEMRDYIAMFASAFQRPEQLGRSETYVRGLLGDATRKNIEQMELGLGENVRNLQYFVGQSPWKIEPVLEVHQHLVAETFLSKRCTGIVSFRKWICPNSRFYKVKTIVIYLTSA